MNNSVLLLILGAILVFGYAWYASIVAKKNKAKEALSGIDVQLKKRSDLLPNVLTIAAKFMDHERELIQKVTELRTKVTGEYNKDDSDSVKKHLANAGALDANLGKLMIAVENYPNLKSDQTMIQAGRTYNEVEEQISAARRFYNSAVSELNTSIQIFPGNILAGLAGAKDMPFYEANEADKAPVDASKFFK